MFLPGGAKHQVGLISPRISRYLWCQPFLGFDPGLVGPDACRPDIVARRASCLPLKSGRAPAPFLPHAWPGSWPALQREQWRGGCCVCPRAAASRLAHQPLKSIENQPRPSDYRDRNHEKIEGPEQAGAHQCERGSGRMAPFRPCMRMPNPVSARRTSSRNSWRSRYCFATPAFNGLGALLVGADFGLFITTSALKRGAIEGIPARAIKGIWVDIESNGPGRNVWKYRSPDRERA
jgi:hypothetical protein